MRASYCTASAFGTSIVYVWGEKNEKKLVLILAVEEAHTVLLFIGGKATREHRGMKFSLLSAHLH